MNFPKFQLPILALISLLSPVLSPAHEVADPAHFVTESLSVSGEVNHPLQLSVSDLKLLPAQTFSNVAVIGMKATHVIKALKGVLLKDVLSKSEISSKTPDDTKRMYIVATASDGYKALFSWNELFNSPIGEGVLVAYEKNGTEIPPTEGKILLISTKDFKTGARHVKWLKSVEVRKIKD